MSSTTREKQAGSGLTLLVASLTFGLFFGAGNLIFPASLGVQSGSATMWTTLGFLLTAVACPSSVSLLQHDQRREACTSLPPE